MSTALDTAVLSFSEDEKMTYVETKCIDVKANGILKGTFIKHGHHCFMSFGSAVERAPDSYISRFHVVDVGDTTSADGRVRTQQAPSLHLSLHKCTLMCSLT